MRLDSGNRSFFALAATALVPHVLLGLFGCGVLSVAAHRLATEGLAGLERDGQDLRPAVVFFGLVTAGTIVGALSVRRQVRATRALATALAERTAPAPAAVAGMTPRLPRRGGAARCHTHVYRLASILMDVDRVSAEVWASWFRCLGDASRVLILNRLALARRPMSVGEIVDAVDVGQPTVSHHLKILAEVGFVLVEQRANVRLYRVNDHCLEVFPSAAELVMGQLPRYDPVPTECRAPWQQAEEPDGNGSVTTQGEATA